MSYELNGGLGGDTHFVVNIINQQIIPAHHLKAFISDSLISNLMIQ
jgi:hypothetical protein